MNENTNMIPCAVCGALHDVSDLSEVNDGSLVCESCLQDGYAKCDDCGEWFPTDDLSMTDDGDLVCESCLQDDYFCCERCGEWHHMGYAVSVNGDECWCDDCADRFAYSCDHCGELHSSSGMTYRRDNGDNLDICDRCSDYYVRCDECGDVVHIDDAVESGYNWYCESCWNSRRHGIRNYSYKPDPDFAFRKGEDEDTTLTFGVELEVDNGDEDPDETAQDVTDAAEGRVYCKHDGSLSEGFEIVSHPASLAYHQYTMRWANLMRICMKAGFKSHDTDTCGLHIHVGRKQLGSSDEERRTAAAKLVILAQVLQENLVPFTRRQDSRLARWAAFSCIDLAGSEDEIIQRALDTRYNGRYQAVNLENRSTVEFRIFRGTLKRDTLIASMQLVSNLCKYAMTHTALECVGTTFADVVNLHPYDELVEYSRKRGILAPAPAATMADN